MVIIWEESKEKVWVYLVLATSQMLYVLLYSLSDYKATFNAFPLDLEKCSCYFCSLCLSPEKIGNHHKILLKIFFNLANAVTFLPSEWFL